MTRSINLGMPRIGPRRDQAGGRALLVGRHRRGRAGAGGRAGGPTPGAPSGRPASTASRPTTSRSTTRCSTPAAWSAPCPSATAGGRPGRPRHLLRHGAGTERGHGRAPLEMTKWFDTNYHYLVPELGPGTEFRLASTKPVDELVEARDLGIGTRPVLVGPVTFLRLANRHRAGLRPARPARPAAARSTGGARRLAAAARRGCSSTSRAWSPTSTLRRSMPCRRAYEPLAAAATGPPAAGHLLRRPGRQPRPGRRAAGRRPARRPGAGSRPAGGRDRSLAAAPATACCRRGSSTVATCGAPTCAPPSAPWATPTAAWATGCGSGPRARCSTCPTTSSRGTGSTPTSGSGSPSPTRSWRGGDADRRWNHGADDPAVPPGSAPATRRSPTALAGGRGQPAQGRGEVETGAGPHGERRRAAGAHGERPARPRAAGPAARPSGPRCSGASSTCRRCPPPPSARSPRPTTSAGPGAHAAGELGDDDYRDFCRAEIAHVIRAQEEARPRRARARRARAQRHGAVLRRAPGRASRPRPRLGAELRHALRPTAHPLRRRGPAGAHDRRVGSATRSRSPTGPVKGMLTGPVTILQWSFVRDDQPREQTCRRSPWPSATRSPTSRPPAPTSSRSTSRRCARAAPARHADRKRYLDWATECFRLATAGVGDATQVHTHMCYAEFGDIIDAIVALDADVISIEAARSRHGGARRPGGGPLPGGGGAGHVRHPCAPRAERGRDGHPARPRPGGAARRPAVGEPRLRAEDPGLGRGAARPGPHGRRHPARPCPAGRGGDAN